LIGQTVGLIFVGAAFFIFFTVNIRPLLGDMVMLKWGSMTCLFSSGLLCYGINKAPSIVILADLLLFTAGFIASSVAEGKAMACATPGTFFSIENAWTIRNVLKCNLSRFVGPVLARYAIAADGGKLYAVSQLSLGVTAVALCCGIALVESRVGETAKSANGLDAAKEARRQQGIAQTATGGTPFVLLSPRNRKKFRLGICGLGNVSQYYLENISKHLSDRFELVVGADPDASQRSKLGEGIATAKDLDGLLSHDLDCVVISAPTAAHFAVTSKAIAAGIPVLLEKPATTSMQELEELYELNGTGRPLHIAMHASFAQEVLWMAAHRDDFGALLDFDAWFFDPYVVDGKPTKHAQNLGGSWLDSGINAITCLSVAFGRDVVVLGLDQETASGDHGSADVATTARARIGNVEGTVRTDWRRGLNEKGIRLRFERASVSLQLTLQRVVVDGHVLEDFSASPRMLTRYGEVLKDFARALDTQTDNREFALSVHRSLFSTQNL
jgi:predicted dehydrogenase